MQKRQISDRQNRWTVHYSKRQICLFCTGRKNWYFLSKIYTTVEYLNMFMSNFLQNFSNHFHILKNRNSNRAQMSPGTKTPSSLNSWFHSYLLNGLLKFQQFSDSQMLHSINRTPCVLKCEARFILRDCWCTTNYIYRIVWVGNV